MSAEAALLPTVWPAPAKLNLFLHITGQRADGYHELQTVFQFLNISDSLRFGVREDGRLRRVTAVPGVAEADDLVIRAARLLQAESGCSQGADIYLHKRLPMGGGLGGGSSDAATTLVALNQLWRLGLDEDRLAALGLRLGADVPVFVRGRAAWAEGVGERLTPVNLPEPWFVILAPAVHVATAKLFADPRLTRNAQPIKIRDYLGWLGSGGAGNVSGALFCPEVCPESAYPLGNVFEPLVRAEYREIDAALRALQRFAPARLTGTGSCVFAAFAEEKQAREVAARLEPRWQTLVAAGCNGSPLFV